ncbi:AraC family ligand binding domain-containing protein [Klebsiella sp. WOUb02]|uniref:AraC family ligand binding domain-containing protein n=1 Tax=Klebsiella sp. WOUb02 TaxID=3161071 RepID=UPI003CF4A9C7
MMMRTETFDYQRGHVTEWHEHDEGQIYWLKTGIMVVETEQAQWTVTPGSVGWFPAGIRHRAQVPGQLGGTSLYLHLATCARLPPAPGIYGSDSFIQALLERLCAGPWPGFPADYASSLLSLLTAEIAHAAELPLQPAVADRSPRAQRCRPAARPPGQPAEPGAAGPALGSQRSLSQPPVPRTDRPELLPVATAG